MISQQTATDIAVVYREIETAEKLLAEVRDAVDRFVQKDIRDTFGRPTHGLQLGVPSGDNGHRLFNLPYTLAIPVIEAQIAEQKARLEILTQKAIAELPLRKASPREQALLELLDLACEAAATFRDYEGHHRAKIGEEGRLDKANRNAGMASRLEDVIARATHSS